MQDDYTQPSLDLETKHCHACDRTLPITAFHRNAARKDGRQSQCAECLAKGTKRSHTRWKEERADDYHAYYQAWYQGHKESLTANAREAYAANRESSIARSAAYNKANRLRINERERIWRKVNDKASEYNRRHAARIKNATIFKFTAAQLAEKIAYWQERCWICGAPYEAVDHVKPLAKGGAHALCNLRPICTSCNSSKNAKWPYPLIRNIPRW